MTQNDHLSNEVSIEARVTESGLFAKAKSRAVAAIDRLVGSLVDVPASKLEAYTSRVRAGSRLEMALADVASERIEAGLGDDQAARVADEFARSQMYKLVNKKHVAEKAITYLSEPDPISESKPESDADEVDPDWLNFFGDYAEKASSDKIQDLWARVLAGEIRHPGSFSLATLRLLAELDQQMATWFQEETEFRFKGKYILPPDEFRGKQLERLVFLEEVGLIHHASPVGSISHTFTPGPEGFAVVVEGNLCLRMRIDHQVQVNVIPLTRMGKEIATILPAVDPISVFKRLAAALPPEVNSIDVCRILAKHEDQLRVSDPIAVLRPADTNSG